MSSGALADGEGGSSLRRGVPAYDYPLALRGLAKLVSYAFHPVFIPVYIMIFLLYVHPGMFTGINPWKKTLTLIQSIVGYVFFPLITVLLLKGLKFIDSIFLKTQRDRVIPYIACGTWYFWTWYVWRNLPDSPHEIVVLSMAIFLASSLGLIANIYMKISMHALALGVGLSFMFFLALTQTTSFGVYISIAMLITGLVCTSRFIVSDHTAKEVYLGLLVGTIALLISIVFQ